MNPRYRRLLIPGLLVVLIVVVLITSLSHEARGATLTRAGADGGFDVVSTIADPRITESSGLVLSIGHRDLAYTINDSGNAPVVFAIRVSTGKVVGTTKVTGGTLLDTEALSIDSGGNLWIADTGDNDNKRTDATLYALPEPGVGDDTAHARRYPVAFSNGPQDVETLLVNPKTNRKYLVSKGMFGGEVYPLPSSLKSDSVNTLTSLAVEVPLLLTDGAFTPDGRYAVLRTYIGIHVFDAKTWRLIRAEDLPPQPQGETLAMEAGGDSFLIGSEGAGSQLLRVGFSVKSDMPVPTAPTQTPDAVAENPASPRESDINWAPWGLGVAVVALVAVGALVTRRRH